jgi:hypothetical protein
MQNNRVLDMLRISSFHYFLTYLNRLINYIILALHGPEYSNCDGDVGILLVNEMMDFLQSSCEVACMCELARHGIA